MKSTAPRETKRVLTHGLAAGGFVLLTLLMTYPQAAGLRSEFPSGVRGRIAKDRLRNAWAMAWASHALRTSPRRLFDANAFYPRRNALAHGDHLLGSQIVIAPLYWLTDNIVLAVNVAVLLSFVLCGYGAFAVAMELTGNGLASFLAGVVFAFNPHRMAHYPYASVLFCHWTPFVLLFLIRYLRGGHLRDALLTAAFFALQALTSGQMWMLFSLAVGVFIVAWGAWHQPRRLLASGAALLLGLTLALPAFVPYFRLHRELGFTRRIEEADAESADLLSYLSVPQGNWLYSGFSRKLGDVNVPAFPGLIAFALTVVGVWCGGRTHSTERRAVIALAWTAGALAVLALGPYVKLDGRKLCPGPYWFVYSFAPGFDALRAPGRIVGILMLPLAVLAARGAACIRWPRGGGLMHGLMIAGTLLEYACFPLSLVKVPSRDEAPPVYSWLARQPGNFAIVELYLDLGENDCLYMYFSTLHWKRLVNGSIADVEPENNAKFMTFVHFPSPESIEVLRRLNVHYVIFRPALLKVDTDPGSLKDDLKAVADFGDTIVYEVLRRSPTRPREKPLPSVRRLPRNEWSIAGAPGPNVEKMADGNPHTVWRGPAVQRAGDDIVIVLRRPQPVCGVLLEFGWAANFFPRYFAIELSDGDGVWHEAAGKSAWNRMYADLYMSCLERPKNPRVSIRFPARVASRVRIRIAKDALLPWMIADISVLTGFSARQSISMEAGSPQSLR